MGVRKAKIKRSPISGQLYFNAPYDPDPLLRFTPYRGTVAEEGDTVRLRSFQESSPGAWYVSVDGHQGSYEYWGEMRIDR